MKTMTKLMLAATVAISGISAATAANAAIVVYTTEGAFVAANPNTILQDFNTFTTRTSFDTSPVNVAGQFTVSRSSSNGQLNAIGPSNGSEVNVNGTPDIQFFNASDSPSVFLTFASPITSFGGIFQGFNNSGQSRLVVNGQIIDPGASDPFSGRFFGFTSTDAFSTVEIRSSNNDVAGLDNVRFATAAGAVPETATWGMMTAGFGMVGAAMRTRRRSTKVTFA